MHFHLSGREDANLHLVARIGFSGDLPESLRRVEGQSFLPGFRALQTVPLLSSEGQPLGLLLTCGSRPRRPSAREDALLELCARQAELVVESNRGQHASRRNEVGLRLALDAGEMGCFEWNIRTGEIWWSDNLEAIHGLPPGTFRGTFESFRSLIHPDDRERVLEAIRHSVEDGSSYEAEFRSANLDGDQHWLMGKGRVLTDEHGRSSRMLGICMDITQRKRAEETIREADRRKDEFLAMISMRSATRSRRS